MTNFIDEQLCVTPNHYQVFEMGSKTYFNSTRFFPTEKRDMVTILYAFVRVADDYVDQIPQNETGFRLFCKKYKSVKENQKPCGDPIIDEFVKLEHQVGFDPSWTEAFLNSMKMDLSQKQYNTLDETLIYIYGSAEVIGLFMARIMQLPNESFYYAKMLGRAMQYINFLRDINEDNKLGRRYLPLKDTSLTSLYYSDVKLYPDEFKFYIRKELNRYFEWQHIAETGFKFISRKLRIPIKTASQMYFWTGKKIYENPMLIFEKKVKPTKIRIILQGIWNQLH